MRANLDARRALLLSEPMMRALADRIGKHAAHEEIYAAAMHAVDNGGDLAAIVAERGLLTQDQISAATDPTAALGSTTDFVDRVLAGRQPQRSPQSDDGQSRRCPPLWLDPARPRDLVRSHP
jgi:adenylosuccinate lyase